MTQLKYKYLKSVWLNLFATSTVFFCVDVSALNIYQDYWVAVKHAPIFDRPNGDAIGDYKWAERVSAYVHKQKTASRDWIPILKYQANPKFESSYLWLRRQDLWDGKPKKVIACWPIKRIEYTVGDWAIEIDFKTDGSGVANELISIEDGNLSPYKTHAYMSQNIVQLNALDKDKRHFFTAGFRPEDRHLYPNGTKEWTVQILFTAEELEGCSGQPVIQK